MKLLFVSNQRLPTEKAYGRQIATMCLNFAKIPGVDLELVYPSRHNIIQDDLFEYFGIEKNFKVSKVKAPDFYASGWLELIAFGMKNLLSALILARAVLSRKPDLVYSRDELPLYILSFFRKDLILEAHKVQNPRLFMYRRLRNCDVRIVAISRGLQDAFIELGFSTRNIFVAPDGVDAAVVWREEKNPSDKQAVRLKLGLPTDKKIAVYAGSLFAWKGIYTLVDAAKLLPEIYFLIVGGDRRGDEDDVRRYLAEKNIGNATITGYIRSEETIRDYLSAANVLLLPNTAKDKVSLVYTSPLKLFSYMAARRPIVASDLPSLREILDEHNSVLVKPDDAQALAEGIKKILGNPITADLMSEAAFRDVKQYTWEKRAEHILEFLS